MLQPPFYHSSNPSYLNFGAIGSIIGHELSHAFDSIGRKFDGDGVLKDWWSESDEAEFNERRLCFIDLFDSFSVWVGGEKFKLNGELTVNENIADAGLSQFITKGGLTRSWEAWKRTGNNFKIKGLEGYTPEQLFFIAYGTSWCSVEQDEYLKRQVMTSVHAPARFRVNSAVMNHAEFGRVFQCKEGSEMNPINKCKVW